MRNDAANIKGLNRGVGKLVNKGKALLASHVGKKVRIRLYQPRVGVLEHEAVLLNLSEHVFVLDIIHPTYRERVAFNYNDLFCDSKAGGVKLLCN